MMTSSRVLLGSMLASWILFAAKPEGAAGSFTIEQVMSAPFASAPIAAPVGAGVAWLLNESGRRNVWVASAPDWKGRKVTNFKDDDGQEIAELSWGADGSYLLFARGGDFEMGRDNPNPAIRTEKPDQEIWAAYLDSRPAKKLTDGHSPVVSPKGDLAAFIREGAVYLMKPTGEQIEKRFTAKGVGELAWSSDGKSLSFVSNRGDHSFVGLYRTDAKTLTYLNPSVDHDGSPSWSPDGSRIAYVRVPASSRPFAFGPEREGQPWSIWITNVNDGESRCVFHAEPGAGSVFHPAVGSSAQLFWTSDNRLLFPWEKTGWLHLYSVDSGGGSPKDLTPGDGEVENVSASKDGGTIYYSTNIGDIDRRHLEAINVGHAAEAGKHITQGDDIEWAPTPAADGSALVYLASSYRAKAHAVVRMHDGQSKDLAPETVPASFPAAELVKPQPVLITAADGMVVHGQLFLPPGKTAERRPALIFFHGGSRRQMLLAFNSMYYYSNAFSMNEYLANHGYVVLSVNYRSGIGYGLNFREALNYGATGASEFNDVIGAGLYLKGRADVDPNRIGVWGGSYGGYLTALALARASDLFAAGVDFHGVHDWNAVIENFVPAYDPKTQADAARVAFESSPLAFVKGWKSPVLLIHGDDDRNVPFSETVHLAVALREANVPFEELIFPNEIHDFLLHKDWVTAYEAAAQFFQAKLLDRSK